MTRTSDNKGTGKYHFVGPLNLNRKAKKASTSWGKGLSVNANQFDALDLLATNEGKPISFEPLYMAIWHTGDGSCNREKAMQELFNLMAQVNNDGDGFMRVVYTAETGYTFQSCWGHNWQ